MCWSGVPPTPSGTVPGGTKGSRGSVAVVLLAIAQASVNPIAHGLIRGLHVSSRLVHHRESERSRRRRSPGAPCALPPAPVDRIGRRGHGPAGPAARFGRGTR